jgi:hypothetical protein
MLVCDGPTGLPDAVNTVWPATIVQTCVVHLLRNSFRYVARQDWEKIAMALRPVCTAPTEEAALERLVEFTDAWGGKYPAIVRLWEDAWAEFVPFLQFDVEIRKAVRARGHFPHRPGRPPKMRVPGRHEPGHDRHRTQTLGHALEGRTPSLQHHLRRPLTAGRR